MSARPGNGTVNDVEKALGSLGGMGSESLEIDYKVDGSLILKPSGGAALDNGSFAVTPSDRRLRHWQGVAEELEHGDVNRVLLRI
jgi:hypothetical protein